MDKIIDRKIMDIRKCKEEEIPTAGAFYDEVVAWLDEHINYPKWSYKVYPSEPYVEAMTEKGDQYLCLEGQDILAAFVLNADPQGNYQKAAWGRELPDGTYMVLHALAVKPEIHGKGVASEIIRFCMSQAKKQGYQALRVDVVPENLPAKRLYEKNGFTCAGEVDLERGIEEIPFFTLYERNC